MEINSSKNMKLFGISNLMLESNLNFLNKNMNDKGINIRTSQRLSPEEKINREFFDTPILKSAEKMSRFYINYYCIENIIRKLINDVLEEKHDIDWWDNLVPPDLKENVEAKIKKEKDTTISRIENPLTYTSFGDLIKIFESNWIDFQDILRSKKSMRETLLQLNKLRNVIAHSCELDDLDIQRFNLHIKDWFLRVLK